MTFIVDMRTHSSKCMFIRATGDKTENFDSNRSLKMTFADWRIICKNRRGDTTGQSKTGEVTRLASQKQAR